MRREPMTNMDLLEWFSDEEREVCSACGERASVTFEGVRSAFCMNCGVITVDGRTIEIRR